MYRDLRLKIKHIEENEEWVKNKKRNIIKQLCVLDQEVNCKIRLQDLCSFFLRKEELSRPEHGPLCSLSQPGNDDCALEKREHAYHMEGSLTIVTYAYI